jgi:hypothetical protein
MERVKIKESEIMEATVSKPRWRKLGGGSLRIGKQIIKPGQIFAAFPEEISIAFRNLVEPVSGNAVFTDKSVAPAPAPVNVVNPVYKIKQRSGFTLEQKGKSPLWFNVLNEIGEVVNEKSLKKADAEKLVEEAGVWFDIVDNKDKVLNEKPLKKEVAEKLVEDLLK